MHVRPAHLNASIAWLFILGSSCFVLGSVPAYVNAVGGVADAITYFVGSIFFTAASYAQLLQAQSPEMTGVDHRQQGERRSVVGRAWLREDRGWLAALIQFGGTLFFNVSTFAALARNATVEQEDRHVWRPDLFGSTLFLVASVLAILALPATRSGMRGRSFPWWIAWLNMIGSVFFMGSAIASYVLPSTGDLINSPVSVAGTLIGALCFLVGAAIMFPAWRAQLLPAGGAERP
jgi:hypothetical protein